MNFLIHIIGLVIKYMDKNKKGEIMYYIYENEGSVVGFKNNEFLKPEIERHDESTHSYTFAEEKFVNDEMSATIIFKHSVEETEVSVICLDEKTNWIQDNKIKLKIDNKITVLTSNELGEAILKFSSKYTNLVVSVNYQGEMINIFELHKQNISDEDLITIMIEKNEKGNNYFLHIPELNYKKAFDGPEQGVEDLFCNLPTEYINDERGRVITAKKLIKKLKKHGFKLIAVDGSHHKMRDSSGHQTIVPFHNGDIPKGTLASILRQSNLTWSQIIS